MLRGCKPFNPGHLSNANFLRGFINVGQYMGRINHRLETIVQPRFAEDSVSARPSDKLMILK